MSDIKDTPESGYIPAKFLKGVVRDISMKMYLKHWRKTEQDRKALDIHFELCRAFNERLDRHIQYRKNRQRYIKRKAKKNSVK